MTPLGDWMGARFGPEAGGRWKDSDVGRKAIVRPPGGTFERKLAVRALEVSGEAEVSLQVPETVPSLEGGDKLGQGKGPAAHLADVGTFPQGPESSRSPRFLQALGALERLQSVGERWPRLFAQALDKALSREADGKLAGALGAALVGVALEVPVPNERGDSFAFTARDLEALARDLEASNTRLLDAVRGGMEAEGRSEAEVSEALEGLRHEMASPYWGDHLVAEALDQRISAFAVGYDSSRRTLTLPLSLFDGALAVDGSMPEVHGALVASLQRVFAARVTASLFKALSAQVPVEGVVQTPLRFDDASIFDRFSQRGFLPEGPFTSFGASGLGWETHEADEAQRQQWQIAQGDEGRGRIVTYASHALRPAKASDKVRTSPLRLGTLPLGTTPSPQRGGSAGGYSYLPGDFTLLGPGHPAFTPGQPFTLLATQPFELQQELPEQARHPLAASIPADYGDALKVVATANPEGAAARSVMTLGQARRDGLRVEALEDATGQPVDLQSRVFVLGEGTEKALPPVETLAGSLSPGGPALWVDASLLNAVLHYRLDDVAWLVRRFATPEQAERLEERLRTTVSYRGAKHGLAGRLQLEELLPETAQAQHNHYLPRGSLETALSFFGLEKAGWRERFRPLAEGETPEVGDLVVADGSESNELSESAAVYLGASVLWGKWGDTATERTGFVRLPDGSSEHGAPARVAYLRLR